MTLEYICFSARAGISSIYTEIENYNFEAEKVRDVGISVETMPGPGLNEPAVKAREYLAQIRERLKQDKERLRKRIEELLSQDWWNPPSM